MNNPRDWSAGLWLIVRQGIIILGCIGLIAASCAVIVRAILRG